MVKHKEFIYWLIRDHKAKKKKKKKNWMVVAEWQGGSKNLNTDRKQ
jgi:hypothetical protein